ncbi:MAG TPA: LacI family DNA-binding transcriptional regulator [Tetrasphaera sp.]|uniref:LacI family DNA-binding transcriptional regulator n=1 Tax=Nostocoides sp. TaxID=1917966 RepID=UPI002CFD66ED|nr:LacI family DNA-binding transcriptional regulator [Tetrasphaera sp.]HNQ06194.1 LacI family DNA-binding transcriptional regulator [Tetrasphaera sp.]
MPAPRQTRKASSATGRPAASAGQPGRAKRPTLRDVADLAGVSLSTASLVFSGRGPVSDATAARVRAAAQELAYAGPNPLASSLRQGRTGTVGVVVEGRLGDAFGDPFALTVLDGLARELDAIPAALLLLPREPGDDSRLLAQLGAAAVDAVVFALCGPRDDPAVDLLAGRGIPMIAAGAPVDPRVPQLLVAERAASADVARLLVGLGHTRIGHITLPLAPRVPTGPVAPAQVALASYPDGAARALGVLDVAPDARVVQTTMADVASGEQAARLLLGVPAHERPTAIIAQSDVLAAGVLRVAADLGLRVPEDLSVTGFDGLNLPWVDVRLTTVVQDGQAKGRALGAMVAAALSGASVRTTHFPTHLRLGETTGPPPTR